MGWNGLKRPISALVIAVQVTLGLTPLGSAAYPVVRAVNAAATSGNQGSAHLLASITAPNGQVILSNQFDELGRLTASSDALGQSSQQSFDLAASRQTMTDRRGNKTVYTFDADGNITAVTNALGQTTRTAFDANGNETSTTDPLVKTTYPDGTSDSSEYDDAGRVVASADRLGVRPPADQHHRPQRTSDPEQPVRRIGALDRQQRRPWPKQPAKL
jgi:YD repeat-containing protein